MPTIISIVGDDNMLRSQNERSHPSLFAFCQPCHQQYTNYMYFINVLTTSKTFTRTVYFSCTVYL